MKQFLLAGLLLMSLVCMASAQPTSVFINEGSIICPPAIPPQIDATNFINNGLFNISLSGNNVDTTLIGQINFVSTLTPFQFSDVLGFTNRGTMSCDNGFIFNTSPSTVGTAHRAASFGNANVGTISSGSVSNSFNASFTLFAGPGVSLLSAVPAVKVSATNIVSAGVLSAGVNGFLSLDGANVNLTRGTMRIESFEDFAAFGAFNATLFTQQAILQGISFNIGIFDNYWGVGAQSNLVTLGNFFLPFPFSSSSAVTTATSVPTFASVQPPNALAFANTNQINPSNITYQVVFINNNLTGVTAQVSFAPLDDFAVPVIKWSAVVTNAGQIATNTLFLSDYFGAYTNLALVTQNFTISGVPQPSPFNYIFSRGFIGFDTFPAGNTLYRPSLFANAFDTNAPFSTTNEYSAYSVSIGQTTVRPDFNLPGSVISNTPGRIVINADKVLDLTRAKITGPNYMNLLATNHYVGSTNAQIISPYMDINLGSTNGQMNITNLVAPLIPRINGKCDLWSARWTNIVAGVTNRYHVLIVDAELAPTAQAFVLNLGLRSTNVVISDILNVVSNALITAQSLTLSSNSVGSPTSSGQLNLSSANLIWTGSLPLLQSLTNWGVITMPNSAYFAGVRQAPYFTTNFTQPYQSFVNHGSISTSGNTTWATYFENSGSGTNPATISSKFGPMVLQAGTAVMSDGSFAVSGGDVNLACGSLSISSQAIVTSGALSLYVTNQITDGGGASNNSWQVSDGFNLPIKPVSGDLLGTTVNNICPAGAEVENLWAGLDFGASSAGFANNGAIGHIILDGSDANSSFHFTAAGAQNALYVDLLELKNSATNRAAQNGVQFFVELNIDPNMTIYFADALIGNLDISEKLDGANGGRLHWVPSFVGTFSSTNITYPSGATYTFNRALASSTSIDSNGNGSPNAYDKYPILTPETLKVSITTTNKPLKTAMISWQTPAHSTNYVYYKTNYAAGPWSVLTNFVQGSANANVTVTDPVRTNGAPAYYKVRVDPAQP